MLSTLHFFSRVLPCLQASTVPSISERSILRAKFEEDLFPTAHPFLVAASAHSWILGCPPFFLPQRGDAQEKKLCSCCRQADPLARRFFRSRGRNLYHGILPANSKFSCHSPFLRLLVFLVCICIGLWALLFLPPPRRSSYPSGVFFCCSRLLLLLQPWAPTLAEKVFFRVSLPSSLSRPSATPES